VGQRVMREQKGGEGAKKKALEKKKENRREDRARNSLAGRGNSPVTENLRTQAAIEKGKPVLY